MVYDEMAKLTLEQLNNVEFLDSLSDEQIRQIAWLLHWRSGDIDKQTEKRGMR